MSFATADLYDEHAEHLAVARPALRSLGGRARFCGPAATVRAPEDNSLVRETLGQPGRGRVLVVDGGGSLRCALLGDRLGALAVEQGWSGVVVWGCVRDAAILATQDLGVLALATVPAKSDKRGLGSAGEALAFLDVCVRPGDWIFADEDGWLVAPDDLRERG